MKNLTGIAVLVILATLVACVDLFDAHDEHVTGEYYLIAIDVRKNMSLCYRYKKSIFPNSGSFAGVVGSTLFAIGYDDRFIIAKQHPQEEFKTDKSVTTYWIVPLKFKVHKWPDKNRIGPLTEAEFEAKRKELGVSESLKFTKVFKDLE